MWSWDELRKLIRKTWVKNNLQSQISDFSPNDCCLLLCTSHWVCVCKWETVCSKSFTVFFRKTANLRVPSPGWGNRTDPIPSKFNPSLVQVSQFRLRYSQSVTMVPITGGISETRSESSSQSLPQQQYEGGTLWKRLGVLSEEQLMVPVDLHYTQCHVMLQFPLH